MAKVFDTKCTLSIKVIEMTNVSPAPNRHTIPVTRLRRELNSIARQFLHNPDLEILVLRGNQVIAVLQAPQRFDAQQKLNKPDWLSFADIAASIESNNNE